MDLTARLAALREAKDTSMVSADTSPTPLATFLGIYNRAKDVYHPDPEVPIIKGSCYTNYMEGAKILYKWLSPIVIPDIPANLLPTFEPAIFHSYEITQIANILSPYKDTKDMTYHKYLKQVIVYLTLKDIMK